VAAQLDKFKDEPLAIGPTTYTPKIHIDVTRPMTIVEAQKGKYTPVAKYGIKDVPPIQY